ncbi:hypothetical protein D9M69_702230 [compost metagenome]
MVHSSTTNLPAKSDSLCLAPVVSTATKSGACWPTAGAAKALVPMRKVAPSATAAATTARREARLRAARAWRAARRERESTVGESVMASLNSKKQNSKQQLQLRTVSSSACDNP